MSLGIDIVKIDRIEKAMANPKFLNKILTCAETDEGTHKNPVHTAAVFAAKEAFSKAIGTGFRGFGFGNISVLHTSLGKPYFVFDDIVKNILSTMGVTDAQLSISHEKDFAVAVVCLNYDAHYKAYTKAILKFENNLSNNAITREIVKQHITKRQNNIHKGDCGRLFVLAGSTGLTGAAIMCCKSALKSGAGLITLGCAQSLNSVFEIAMAEVMTLPLKDVGGVISCDDLKIICERANASDCLLIGPGLRNTPHTRQIVCELIKKCEKPLIIDADGINALCGNIDILANRKAQTVLTPHIGEFARLTGICTDEILKNTEKYAKEFSALHNVTIVLKSHRTVVAKGENTYVNILGNPGMATGGSGDVLAGIIASFTAQGIPCEFAAASGVYIHSLAADMAAYNLGEYGLTPTDIIEYIPYAIKFTQ